MDEFVRIALSFPALPFSLMMGVVALYWLSVVAGALDIDLFDVDLEFDGAVDGAVDGVVDGALDGVVDGAVDGALESAGAMLKGLLAGMLSLGRVPVTISASFFTVFAWVGTFAATHALEGAMGAPLPLPARIGVFGVGVVAALALAGLVVRPMRPLFATHTRRGQETLIGRTVTVNTGRVDARFGQGLLDDGGAGLILSIRCETPNELRRGDRALIIGYDTDTHLYMVEPYDALFGTRGGPGGTVKLEARAQDSDAAGEPAAATVDSQMVRK